MQWKQPLVLLVARILAYAQFHHVISEVWNASCKSYSNSANKSSEEGARGGWLPADEDDDGGVARSSPNAGASKYDSSSIGSTLVSGKSWNRNRQGLAFVKIIRN